MQKTNTINTSSSNRMIIPIMQSDKVAVVITTIISTITESKCSLILYHGSNAIHTMSFQCPQNQTIFIDSKLFIPQGYSLGVYSETNDTTFTVMYDQSQNI